MVGKACGGWVWGLVREKRVVSPNPYGRVRHVTYEKSTTRKPRLLWYNLKLSDTTSEL